MLKVIVADDMEMIREGIRAMLEQLPSGAGALEIRTASSGAEAVRLMERGETGRVRAYVILPYNATELGGW